MVDIHQVMLRVCVNNIILRLQESRIGRHPSSNVASVCSNRITLDKGFKTNTAKVTPPVYTTFNRSVHSITACVSGLHVGTGWMMGLGLLGNSSTASGSS